MNLPRAADGMHDLPETRGTLIEIIAHEGVAAIGGASRSGRCRRLTGHGGWNKTQILIDIVDGNVKAGVVGQVENIEAVLQCESFRQLRQLHDGNIGPLLPRLAEDVALPAAGDEIGLERITRRNGTAQVARLEDRYCKAGSL